MRPSINVLVLLSFIFVLHTGYYPTDKEFSGYEIVHPKELNAELLENSSSRAILLSDVQYGPSDSQRFDIYLPPGRNERYTKVLILLHGGSWIRGDKSGMKSFVASLLDQFPDHAILNMNYTLGGEDQFAFPQQFMDIRRVVDHITLLSSEYKVSPTFGIIGRSSGGHLGLIFDSVYDTFDQVKFVCSIAGPTNLTDPLFTRNADFELLHTILIDSKEYSDEPLKALSPLYNASNHSSPSLLLYGEDDKKVPITNGLDYSQKLDKLNVFNELHTFEGGHSNTWNSENWQISYDRIAIFVDAFLN